MSVDQRISSAVERGCSTISEFHVALIVAWLVLVAVLVVLNAIHLFLMYRRR